MHYRNESPHIDRKVQCAKHILALSHANPDADSIASLLSFQQVFASENRTVTMAIGAGTVPETLDYLPGLSDLIRADEITLSGFDLIVMLDCADEGRVGPVGEQIVTAARGNIPIINIDHHVTNTRFGDVNLIDAKCAATCEILALLYRDLDTPIDSTLATTLMSGIQGDTLGLRTPSTTGQTLEVSAVLLRAGADLDTIIDYLFRIRPFSTLKLWGKALSAAEIKGTLVWTEVTSEMLEAAGADESEGEGIVNFLAGTRGARAAALLYRKPDGWRISMRSLTDEVDVSQLAGLYGGGGHSRAAGCTLLGDESVRDEFLETISRRIETNPVPASSDD